MIVQKGQYNEKKFFIAALSRYEMEGLEVVGFPHMVISITSPEEKREVKIQTNPEVLMRLCFYDLSQPKGPFTTLFTQEMADTVVKTVRESLDKISGIIVHCNAGVCRSVGLAAAFSKVYFEDDSKFFKEGIPNQLVYKLMMETLMKGIE